MNRRIVILDWDDLNSIWSRMHMIVAPGEYGLGTEPGSIPDDDKKAWEEIERLLDELSRAMTRGTYERRTR